MNKIKPFIIFVLFLLMFDQSSGNKHFNFNNSSNKMGKILIDSSLWIAESRCETIPGISCNSSFNGIQKIFDKNCPKNLGVQNCEKYIPCKVKSCNLNGDWSSWGPWNCDDCSNDSKLAIRKRICEKFYEGQYCVTDKRGISNYEMMDCDEVCFKVWSEWSPWSTCTYSNSTCKAQKTRSRSCLGYGRKCPCNQFNYTETECYFVTKNCDALIKSNNCKDIHEAKWNQWGKWSQCYSNGQMSRKRTCNKASNTLAGCFGASEEFWECENSILKSVHGGFSKWSEWSECNAVFCQKGWATRYRKCNNPKPSRGGYYCNGPEIENKECQNWNDTCKDDLDKKMIELRNLSKQLLDMTSSNFVKKEFETLKLEINENLIKINKAFLSNLKIFWYLNGKRLVIEKSRMISNENFLLINELLYKDSGTYYCILQMDSFDDVVTYEALVKNHTNQFLVIGLYSLVVVSNHVKKISARNIKSIFDCKQKYLEYFLKKNNSQLLWHTNSFKLKSQKNQTKNAEFFLCEVKEINSSRFWYTNLIRTNTDLLNDHIHFYAYYIELYNLFPIIVVFYLIVICILTNYIETKNFVIRKLKKSFIEDLNLKM